MGNPVFTLAIVGHNLPAVLAGDLGVDDTAQGAAGFSLAVDQFYLLGGTIATQIPKYILIEEELRGFKLRGFEDQVAIPDAITVAIGAGARPCFQTRSISVQGL